MSSWSDSSAVLTSEDQKPRSEVAAVIVISLEGCCAGSGNRRWWTGSNYPVTTGDGATGTSRLAAARRGFSRSCLECLHVGTVTAGCRQARVGKAHRDVTASRGRQCYGCARFSSEAAER